VPPIHVASTFLRDEDKSCPSCGSPAEQLITGFVACRSSSQVASGAAAAVPSGGHAHHGGCGCGGH
jgi:hypothetical protein